MPNSMIPLFWPQIYKKEWLQTLDKIFDTRWIGQGPMVDEFERQFAKKFKYKYCLVENRDKLIDFLRKNDIECDLVHLRNDIFKVFGGKRQNLPNMKKLEDQYLYLPLSSTINLKDVDYIAKVFKLWQE